MPKKQRSPILSNGRSAWTLLAALLTPFIVVAERVFLVHFHKSLADIYSKGLPNAIGKTNPENGPAIVTSAGWTSHGWLVKWMLELATLQSN